MAKLVDVWIFDWDKYSPDDLVQKDDCFQLGAALLPALAKRVPCYHSRCSRSVASAAIRIKPNRPCVTAASSRANAVPAECPLYPRKRTFAAQ